VPVIERRLGGFAEFRRSSRDLAVPANTLRSHAALLETLFLTARVEAWSSNLLSRLVKTPKAYVADTGLLGSCWVPTQSGWWPMRLLGVGARWRSTGGQVAWFRRNQAT